MANLKVKIGDLEFKNPVMPAAGPPVRNAECILSCVKGGIGGIVTKTISDVAADVPRPCMEEIPGGFLNTELWTEYSPEHWFEKEYPYITDTKLPVIISMGYTAEQLYKIVEPASKFADAFEISTHYVGKDIKPILDALKAAKSTGKPVFMKISPGLPDVAGYAKQLEAAGADGFVAINSVGPCFHIDIETGLPLMGSEKGYGWLSGKAIKPIALRHVYEIANAVSVPVIGVGGIASGKDAIEMMMAGASAVGICTEAILKGPNVYGKIVEEMNEWLDGHGYKDVNEIIGLTAKKLKNRMLKGKPEFPVVNKEKCIGCGRCVESCAYQAITMDKKATIDENKCFRCGLCTTRCLKNAIHFKNA